MTDFARQTGVVAGEPGANSIDVEADGVVVSAQYRAEHDDCVIFSLPLEDTIPDEAMLRRALELAANGDGTGGHFLGLREGMLMLSTVLPLKGLSTEEFGMRMLVLASVSKTVADTLLRTSTNGNSGAKNGLKPDQGENDFMRV